MAIRNRANRENTASKVGVNPVPRLYNCLRILLREEMKRMLEEWKDISGFEGYYQVSNLGHIRSLDRYIIANKYGGKKLLKGKNMKLTKAQGRDESVTKYLVVNLRKEGKSKVYEVHRLVAEAFIPNPRNYPVPNHIDGNKENNMVTNLEWVTYSENNRHALSAGLRKPRGKVIVQYDLSHNELSEYKSASEAARINGLDRGSIVHCLTKRRDIYAGYIWEYK